MNLKKNKFLNLSELRKSISNLEGPKWFFFLLFSIIMSAGAFGALFSLNNNYLIEVPTNGGSLNIGMVGNPSLINPILLITNTDKDISSLVFAGLMKKDSEGEIVPNLASDYEISDDEKTYTFFIKEKAQFHSGKTVTAEDVMFTINLINNPTIKSPKRANWEGVTVEAVDEKTVKFILKEKFTGFLENTTIGILPSDIVKQIDPLNLSQHSFNQHPIGAGPFKIEKVSKMKSGLVEEINLKSFKNYVLGKPYINNIKIKFYGNEEDMLKDLKNQVIERGGPISNLSIDKISNIKIETIKSPKVFGIFLNKQKSKILEDAIVRDVLDNGIDREILVQRIFKGYALPTQSPYPGIIKIQDKDETDYNSILESAGWKMQENGVRSKEINKEKKELEIRLATIDQKDLKDTAEEIKRQLGQYGINIKIETFDIGFLNQNVITERNFDALLFGQSVGRPENLYGFWHSSQKDFPGLNITGYVNGKADQDLSTLISENDPEKRTKALESFIKEIEKDRPAIFLYNSMFLTADKSGLKKPLENKTFEQFTEVENWYLKTDKIWKIFN